MKHIQIDITVTMFFCFFTLLHVLAVSADDFYPQFSLGGGTLINAPTDAKSAEHGLVTAKYGFNISKEFLPYVGSGLAYTYQPDIKTGDITKLKTGVAAQFGFNYLLGINSSLKLDYKYLAVSPDQQRGDSKSPPQSLGIGLDIKF